MILNINIRKIIDFFFFIPSRENRILLFEKIQLISYYVTALMMFAVTAYNVIKVYSDGELLIAFIGILFILLVLTSLILFWITRNLIYSQYIIALLIFLMMSLIIWNGGGRFGLASLYFLSTFSIFFLILDYRTGIILPTYYLIGFTLRLMFGRFGIESIFFQPELRTRFTFVLGISCIFGIIGSVCIKLLVNYLGNLAYTDRVTDLPNSDKFKELFVGKTKGIDHLKNESLTLIGLKVVQIDKTNANYGIQNTNNILREMVKCLKASRVELLSRWSGSIFMAVIPTGKIIDMKNFVSDLLKVLEKPIEIEGNKNSLQYIAALSRYPEDGHAPDIILKHVLTLLEGKNLTPGDIIFYDEAKLKQEQFRFSLKEALNNADLSHDFKLVYQPKLRLIDEKCIGAEVLLRWDKADFGPVSPEDFIPIAEESGVIRTITRWVISTTFDEITRSENTELTYAINLSVLDLKDSGLVSFLSHQRDIKSIPINQIEFEVTEGVQADMDPQIQNTLIELYDMGFKLAIDDFGTGYSSLSYLHKLKVNSLKIDKSFVHLIKSESNQQNYPVIDAIISMGLSMGLDITAEGVETRKQVDYLKQNGCTMAQGWLYSKGLPWEDFLAYIESDHT